VNGNNQISSTGFSYNADGEMTDDANYSYAFNGANEITSANGVNYTYDGHGLRVEKSSGTLYWRAYTGQVIEARGLRPERLYGKTTTSGNMQRDYIFPGGSGFRRRAPTPAKRLNFAGRRIAWKDSSGDVYYYFADALGSTRAARRLRPERFYGMTNSSGTVCFSADYYPYGQENAPFASRMHLRDAGEASPERSRRKFDSPRRLYEPGAARIAEIGPETGNYYAGVYPDLFVGARYYNPRLGRPDAFTDTGRSALSEPDRFMSPDLPRCRNKRGAVRVGRTGPLAGSVDNPQSLNRYTYVRNSPTMMTDPLGFGPCDSNPLYCVQVFGNPPTYGTPSSGCYQVYLNGMWDGISCGPGEVVGKGNATYGNGWGWGGGGSSVGGGQPQTPGPPYVCSGTAQFLNSLDFTTKLGLDAELSKALVVQADLFKNNQTGEEGSQLGLEFLSVGAQLQRVVPAGADITSNTGSNVLTITFGPFQYSSSSGFGLAPLSSYLHVGGAILAGGDVSFNSQRAAQISAQCGGPSGGG
jgi:hypothetical protein